MTISEYPDLDILKRRDDKVIELGGVGVQTNVDDGMEYAKKANEAREGLNRELFNRMVQAAGILIGRKSMGALELQAQSVRRIAGPTPSEEDPELSLRTAMMLDPFAMTFRINPLDKTTDEMLLATAQAMHQMKATHPDFGPSVLAPIELWNRRDVLEEALETGLHPWVAWSARGTSDAIDDANPLYGEFIAADIRVRMEADPTGEY